MREIKFRAWDKYEQRMIHSGTEQNDYPFSWMIHNTGIEIVEHDGTDWNSLKDLVFMQYTGLKDVNVVEIYEGDIIKIQINDWSTGKILILANEVVEFKNGKFGFKWGHYRDFSTFDGFSNTTFEVIGNIYENPELLGGDRIW